MSIPLENTDYGASSGFGRWRVHTCTVREHGHPAGASMLRLKRAYEPPKKEDGYRVLIDRLWPRGIKKSDLGLDEWAKELAPSTGLRRSFGHDPSKWRDFQSQYKRELHALTARQKIDSLARRARRSTVTLVYAAHDEEHNDAVVLKKVIERTMKKSAA